MIRSTTNGILNSYRFNLQRSTHSLNKARDTVLTGRNFNSFAEDPAAAAHCFQMRRSFQRVDSQLALSQSVVSKYEMAWSSLNSVVDDLTNAKNSSALGDIISGSSDATASGRNALGQKLTQMAEGLVQTMNAKYGDSFVFAGADGLNVPLELKDGTLYYRGIDVNSTDPKDMEALDYLANGEKKYADLGLGLQENENGELIESSVFDVTLQAINFLGYGTDGDGDPKNVISLVGRMGEILENCDSNGKFAAGEEEEFKRLFEKFGAATDLLSDKHTELDARAAFLKSNQTQLERNGYTLQEQILGIEDADPAEAISAYSWAQYCYNSALKVGNSILSESLMDYLKI